MAPPPDSRYDCSDSGDPARGSHAPTEPAGPPRVRVGEVREGSGSAHGAECSPIMAGLNNGHGYGHGNGNGNGAGGGRPPGSGGAGGGGRGEGPPGPGITDRLPPQNIEAEQGVLGSILLDNDVLHDIVGE